jgi:DNA-binding response OmpR family regulator
MNQLKLRVLLVDDDETYSRVVSLALSEEFGLDVTVAHGGQEAIDLLRERRREIDVAVLDYRMPSITGIDVLRWMHQNGVTVPAFILTAAGSESVVAEAMKLDAYDYFRKEDTDIEHLAGHIRAVHEKHMARLADALEKERAKGNLRGAPDDKAMTEFVKAMGPALNSTFEKIAAGLNEEVEGLLAKIPQEEQDELRKLFGGMHSEVGRIETAVRGLLSLYTLLYTRHPDAHEISRIGKDLQSQALRPPGADAKKE